MKRSRSTPVAIVREVLRWQEYLSSLRRSPNTMDTYGAALKNLTKFLARRGVARVAEITPQHLTDWQSQLVAAGCAPATVDFFIRAAKAWFRWLGHNGRIFLNPAVNLDAPAVPRKMGRCPSEAQMRCLLESVNGTGPLDLRDRALLEVAYASAARRSELSSLKVDSVDLANGILRIRGKGERERMAPLTKAAIIAVKRYLTDARPRLHGESNAPSLFLSQRGGLGIGSAAVARIIRRRAAGVGLELSPHGIRRAVATHLVNRGAPIYQVKELLGHQSFRHLARYSLSQAANVRNLLRGSRLNR